MCAFRTPQRSHLTAAIHCGLTTDSGRWRWVAFLGATAASLAGNVVPAFATTYVVDTTADVPTPTKTTLRQAVFQANGSANNIVQFDPGLNGSTITLTQGEIAINEPMYVIGPGANKLRVSGNDASRIFNISTASATPIAVMLSGLTMSHGKAAGNLGGAIYASNVSLTVQDSVLDYNTAQEGGAICAHSGNAVASASKLTRATVTKNNATGVGAGIAVLGGASLQISASTISANTSIGSAGAYLKDVGSVSVDTSQITGNHATVISGGGLLIDHYASGLTNVTVSNSGSRATWPAPTAAVSRCSTSLRAGRGYDFRNSADSGGGVFRPGHDISLCGDRNHAAAKQCQRQHGGEVRRRDRCAPDIQLLDRSLAHQRQFGLRPAAGGGGIAIEYAKTPTYMTNSTIYGTTPITTAAA
jgi:hypothetical protein